MAKKLPSMQFYPGDWMKDPAVRACSLPARGLWIDMLCLMHESCERGYLQHQNGKAVNNEQLARMVGCSVNAASRLVRELEDAGVFSRTETGVIYSRRQVRDEETRSKTRERVSRHRGKRNATCNADVTPKKHDTSFSSSVSLPNGAETFAEEWPKVRDAARHFARNDRIEFEGVTDTIGPIAIQVAKQIGWEQLAADLSTAGDGSRIREFDFKRRFEDMQK